MFADEELVMELLINAGQARSDAMEAIRCAGQKDWQGATKLMASSESACLQAHKIQTALISQDEGCEQQRRVYGRHPGGSLVVIYLVKELCMSGFKEDFYGAVR